MNRYELVFVLAAEVIKKSGKYIFPEVYEGLALGGEPRLKAAAKLFELGIIEKVVCVGGSVKGEEDVQKSEIMRDRLVKYYKIPAGKIEAFVSDPHTEGNVNIIKEYLEKNKIRAEDCAFLTNFIIHFTSGISQN
ncbi:unnamed protein product [marine sediment metagenome]|uniref:DUF218 domain-containing protein n=1 Tax=marine sediment metagenome TaxID=412755 RepID=X1EMK5_9ZZZZ